ncbi:hypothetical protein GCM10009808_23710 [Microbacterium sediminicola]|uniref:Uncharacterized protein n=1 Tax=Microbacterium sediminicola TaxID=415210 RepID=A0ABN2IHM0_9MICO
MDPTQEPWVEEAAEMLEKFTRDPLADAIPGHVVIVEAADPERRGRYQECALTVVTDTPGIPDTRVETAVVTSKKYWPRVGTRLSARISRHDPSHLEVDWDGLAHQPKK